MMGSSSTQPWLRYYGDRCADLDVPDQTLYEMLAASASRWPRHPGLIYMGMRMTFATLLAQVDRCAAALAAAGVARGDSVTLALPNIPNVIVLFYALNRIGARIVMVHPLSSPTEVAHYLKETGSTFAVTVDMFYGRFAPILASTPVKRLLITRVSDYLPRVAAIGFALTRGRSIDPVPVGDPAIVTWRRFMKSAPTAGRYERVIDPDDGAVVLFSGGTTALPKGIELSSAAFNSLAVAMTMIGGFTSGQSVLAILPVFHGFGLGLCIHTALSVGAHPILVPEFSVKIYIDNLVKHRPSYIAGVPTLFEALLRDSRFGRVDFSQLVGAYCGGDSLTADLKHRVDGAIAGQSGTVELVEGYGLTECVTACVLSPLGHYRDGSMGVPIPGVLVKVTDPDTGATLPAGQYGEICITGPTLMKGYINDPEATAYALRTHDDGRTWLHSGDTGWMDSDGYVYFRGRIKRIIKVSGMSVYPMQVEQVLEAHPLVWRACVIGTPDDYQMASVKAFVVLGPDAGGDEARVRDELTAHCRKHLIKWAVPRAIEFRSELPTTLVGKIAYTELEREDHAGGEQPGA
ncbi:MAG: AMP-binding protein [Bifidobacteriaceae bacterium]|jgi:long-chain acyl-CoA synthetase|nr:AMP-binding protein [Bifidobacteriaceae bacterium]